MSSKPSSLFPEEESYFNLLNGLKQQIRTAQIKAALAVNQELLLLYWNIGREILRQQQAQGWGSKIIERLSRDLKREFSEIKGFSPRNLKYMRALAEAYPDEQIVLRVIAQIPWGHNQSLLNKLSDPDQRLWYAQKVIENGWSRNILEIQIESNLYSRQGGAITNFDLTLPPTQSDLSRDLLKDPYNFSFLEIQETFQERELERALVTHIRQFLMELGVGFAFVGSQYRLEVDGDEYFLDLLFYHLKLHCYIVIDLKVTAFKPEYAGKMNFYVTAVNRLLRDERDDPTIGIILCRSKKSTTVEFALETVQNPIGVATYQLQAQLPPALQAQLPTPQQLEVELDFALKSIESSSLPPSDPQEI